MLAIGIVSNKSNLSKCALFSVARLQFDVRCVLQTSVVSHTEQCNGCKIGYSPKLINTYQSLQYFD